MTQKCLFLFQNLEVSPKGKGRGKTSASRPGTPPAPQSSGHVPLPVSPTLRHPVPMPVTVANPIPFPQLQEGILAVQPAPPENVLVISNFLLSYEMS